MRRANSNPRKVVISKLGERGTVLKPRKKRAAKEWAPHPNSIAARKGRKHVPKHRKPAFRKDGSRLW